MGGRGIVDAYRRCANVQGDSGGARIAMGVTVLSENEDSDVDESGGPPTCACGGMASPMWTILATLSRGLYFLFMPPLEERLLRSGIAHAGKVAAVRVHRTIDLWFYGWMAKLDSLAQRIGIHKSDVPHSAYRISFSDRLIHQLQRTRRYAIDGPGNSQ